MFNLRYTVRTSNWPSPHFQHKSPNAVNTAIICVENGTSSYFPFFFFFPSYPTTHSRTTTCNTNIAQKKTVTLSSTCTVMPAIIVPIIHFLQNSQHCKALPLSLTFSPHTYLQPSTLQKNLKNYQCFSKYSYENWATRNDIFSRNSRFSHFVFFTETRKVLIFMTKCVCTLSPETSHDHHIIIPTLKTAISTMWATAKKRNIMPGCISSRPEPKTYHNSILEKTAEKAICFQVVALFHTVHSSSFFCLSPRIFFSRKILATPNCHFHYHSHYYRKKWQWLWRRNSDDGHDDADVYLPVTTHSNRGLTARSRKLPWMKCCCFPSCCLEKKSEKTGNCFLFAFPKKHNKNNSKRSLTSVAAVVYHEENIKLMKKGAVWLGREKNNDSRHITYGAGWNMKLVKQKGREGGGGVVLLLLFPRFLCPCHKRHSIQAHYSA